MKKEEHIEKLILNFEADFNNLFEKYNIDPQIPIKQHIFRNEDIFRNKDIFRNEDNIDYEKSTKPSKENSTRMKKFFHELKSIERLGKPSIFYYEDDTVKITSSLIKNYRLDGSIDSLSTFKDTYLLKLKEFLNNLKDIKYIQYLCNIEGLILEDGNPKIILDSQRITIRYPFKTEDIDECVNLVKSKFDDFKMEVLSCIIVLKQSENENYIPDEYENYKLDKPFDKCLEDLEIISLYKSKKIKFFIDGKFDDLYYLSSYEYMNNKTNRPYCYIYIKDNRLFDIEKLRRINRIIKLQDNLV